MKSMNCKGRIDSLLKEIELVKGYDSTVSDIENILSDNGNMLSIYVSAYGVTISLFNKTIEDTYSIMAKIRARFGCFYKMEQYPDMGDIDFQTCINGVPLRITNRYPVDCQLIETGKMKPEFRFDCSPELKEQP